MQFERLCSLNNSISIVAWSSHLHSVNSPKYGELSVVVMRCEYAAKCPSTTV